MASYGQLTTIGKSWDAIHEKENVFTPIQIKEHLEEPSVHSESECRTVKLTTS